MNKTQLVNSIHNPWQLPTFVCREDPLANFRIDLANIYLHTVNALALRRKLIAQIADERKRRPDTHLSLFVNKNKNSGTKTSIICSCDPERVQRDMQPKSDDQDFELVMTISHFGLSNGLSARAFARVWKRSRDVTGRVVEGYKLAKYLGLKVCDNKQNNFVSEILLTSRKDDQPKWLNIDFSQRESKRKYNEKYNRIQVAKFKRFKKRKLNEVVAAAAAQRR